MPNDDKLGLYTYNGCLWTLRDEANEDTIRHEGGRRFVPRPLLALAAIRPR